jgi:hypothetical protein
MAVLPPAPPTPSPPSLVSALAPPSPAAMPPAPPLGYPVAQFQSMQVLPVPPSLLASPGRRLGGLLLGFALFLGTLVIGYVVWSIIAWNHSTTPAKQLLGMRVIDSRTGAPATFGQMVMRQVVWSLVLSIGSSVTASILGIVDAFMVFGGTRQRLLDKMANTLVIKP